MRKCRRYVCVYKNIDETNVHFCEKAGIRWMFFSAKKNGAKRILLQHGATVLIGLMEKSHKTKGFEQSTNSIRLKNKYFKD